MTKTEFLRELEEALEIPPGALTPSTALADAEGWDSMAALIFQSLADERFSVSPSGDQLAACTTINDLLDLLGDKLAD